VPCRRILLCGDRSFAARGLIDVLHRDGHRVTAFSRGKLARDGDRVSGPVEQLHENPNLAESFDTVINYILLKDEKIDANDRYLASLIEFCKSHAVKHLIHISSVSVYSGDVTDVHEDATVETIPEKKGSYGSLKVAQDLYLNGNVPSDMRLSMVRPGFILGQGLMDPMIGMGFRCLKNKVLLIGDKGNQLPVITRQQVHEAVAAVVKSPEESKRDAFLVLDNRSPTRQQWLDACCRRLGCGTDVVSFPTILWRAAGIGGEMVARAIGMSIRPNKVIKNACRRQRFDSTVSQRKLGLKMETDWRKALVDSFAGQEPNYTFPYSAIPWKPLDIQRLTIVGYGQVVKQKHLPALKRLEFKGEIAAYDIAARKDENGQEIHAIDGATLPPCDLVVLASPGPVHNRAIPLLKTLDAPLLVEKPLCYSLDELHEWLAFASSRANPTVVCQNFRFKKNVAAMMTHLSKYAPGKLLQVDISFHSPSIGKEWRTWTRDERRARTLLMDYSVHYLDVACMFATQGWQLAHARHEIDHMGFTSLIEGRFDSAAYPVNFLLRQGLMPRRARIRFTFQNYLVSLGFFPDSFTAYMADDGSALYGEEKKQASRYLVRKIADKVTGRDSDQSHAGAYLAAMNARDGFGQGLTVQNLASYYEAVFQLAESVYGSWG
jgi:nucleoside-diphosphate-sugar epimerase